MNYCTHLLIINFNYCFKIKRSKLLFIDSNHFKYFYFVCRLNNKIISSQQDHHEVQQSEEKDTEILHVQKYRRNDGESKERIIESKEVSNSKIDPKLEYIKYYCDGQIRILEVLVEELRETLEHAEGNNNEDDEEEEEEDGNSDDCEDEDDGNN